MLLHGILRGLICMDLQHARRLKRGYTDLLLVLPSKGDLCAGMLMMGGYCSRLCCQLLAACWSLWSHLPHCSLRCAVEVFIACSRLQCDCKIRVCKH